MVRREWRESLGTRLYSFRVSVETLSILNKKSKKVVVPEFIIINYSMKGQTHTGESNLRGYWANLPTMNWMWWSWEPRGEELS